MTLNVNDINAAFSLFAEVRPDSRRIPRPLGELRKIALFIADRPVHRFGTVWLSAKLRSILLKRIGENTDSQTHLEAICEGMARARRQKPLHLSTGPAKPAITPVDIVRGARVLLETYPASAHWQRNHVRESLAYWWGISRQHLKRHMDDLSFADGIARANPAIALFLNEHLPWKRDGDDPTPEHIITATQALMHERARWWDKCKELSHVGRMYGVSHMLAALFGATDFEKDRLALTDYAVLFHTGAEHPEVPDFIGYPEHIEPSGRITEVVFAERAAEAHKLGLKSYYETMDYIGRGTHPYPAIYASELYRHFFAAGSLAPAILSHIGIPP